MTAFTALPGGNTSPARQRFARELERSTRHIGQIPSHVVGLRAIPPPPLPSPSVAVYDHQLDPDRPTLPRLPRVALDVLLRSVLVPGSVPRPQQVEAAMILQLHFAITEDDCPPRGLTRPVS